MKLLAVLKDNNVSPQATAAPAGGSRDDLEQRRNMLQSIKDFDFQIKKNQEEVTNLNEKLDAVTRDLDVSFCITTKQLVIGHRRHRYPP